MKIHVLSDLHLEFADLVPPRPECDLVVLAGDIHVGARATAWIERHFRDVPVVYVLGNHEYYRETMPRLFEKLQAHFQGTNVHVLDRGEVVIGGARVLAATMWTDYDLDGEALVALAAAEVSMNDFRLIRFGRRHRRLRAADLAAEHRLARHWLAERLSTPFDGQTVVVTHHAPTPRSIPKRFRGNVLSASYASNLESLFPSVDLWIHGHTHVSLDLQIGATRVVCNPRGYAGSEPNPEFQPDRVVEVTNHVSRTSASR